MVKRVQDYDFKFQKYALIILLCTVILSLPSICQSHSHQHDAAPSFKYSREANENFNPRKTPESHHHHDHGHDHHHYPDESIELKNSKSFSTNRENDIFSIWLHSIGSTLLISTAPFVLLYIIPLDNTDSMKPRLKVLLAFASGGLLGDAFLHLIPHATHPHNQDHQHHDHGHSHSHDHQHHDHGHHDHSHKHDMSVGLWVLGGIIAFLAVEKLVRLIKGNQEHGHSHGSSKSSKNSKDQKNDKKQQKEIKVKTAEKKQEEVQIAGYLNLAADFAHNFTDGLAIGASYLAGNSIGVITTITILLHEVPHEIGDFAILIKSGCSRHKAMMLQLVTALGSLAGTALALLGAGAGSDTSSTWVLPFTAGGFIYIATVSVLPELLEESTKLGQSIKEILAMLLGVGLMIVIANFE